MDFFSPLSCRGGGPQGRRGFPCTRVTFPFFRPVYVVVDASGVVLVGVRPPPPLWGSSPARLDSLGIRMENRGGVTARAEFIKSPQNFYCPVSFPGKAGERGRFSNNEKVCRKC